MIGIGQFHQGDLVTAMPAPTHDSYRFAGSECQNPQPVRSATHASPSSGPAGMLKLLASAVRGYQAVKLAVVVLRNSGAIALMAQRDIHMTVAGVRQLFTKVHRRQQRFERAAWLT